MTSADLYKVRRKFSVLCKTWNGTFRILPSSVFLLKIVTDLESWRRYQIESTLSFTLWA